MASRYEHCGGKGVEQGVETIIAKATTGGVITQVMPRQEVRQLRDAIDEEVRDTEVNYSNRAAERPWIKRKKSISPSTKAAA
jgi:hypothetical protein